MKFLKPTMIIFYRELLRYSRDPLRILSSLAMPFLWLVMFGSGIASSLRFSVAGPSTDFNYVLFLFPGVLAVNVIFTSLFSAITTVRDREEGFLKEVFVAPVPRSAIVFGKILGGTTVTSVQAFLMVIFLPLVGIPLMPSLFSLIPYIFAFALMLNSLAILISAKIRNSEGFQTVMNFLTFPMFILSGALFPLRNLPGWMSFLTIINPATYGVDMMRHAVFLLYQVPDIIAGSFGVVVFGHLFTSAEDLNLLLIITVIMIYFSAELFSREDV
jgi:ABC-2 type transport system permease protein